MSIVPGHRVEPCSGGFSSKSSDLQLSTSRYRLRHFRPPSLADSALRTAPATPTIGPHPVIRGASGWLFAKVDDSISRPGETRRRNGPIVSFYESEPPATPHCGQFRVDQLLARAQFLYESTLQVADVCVCRPERDRNVDSYKIPTTGVQQLRIADNPGDPNYWPAPTKKAHAEPGRWARRGAGRSWRRNLHPRCPGRPELRPRSRRSRRRSRLRPRLASPYRARSAQAEKPAPRKPRPPKP